MSFPFNDPDHPMSEAWAFAARRALRAQARQRALGFPQLLGRTLRAVNHQKSSYKPCFWDAKSGLSHGSWRFTSEPFTAGSSLTSVLKRPFEGIPDTGLVPVSGSIGSF